MKDKQEHFFNMNEQVSEDSEGTNFICKDNLSI